jgi:glycosyltransferase involved in cell wall biosynthesis
MKQIEILYISYDGMTDNLGQSQVLAYLYGLSKQGYKFHVLSFEKKERYLLKRAEIGKLCDDHGISWYPMNYKKNPPVLSSVIDLYFMQKKAEEIVKNNDIKIVHARGHYLTSIVAEKLKLRSGIKYIFDMRGFWADERVDGNLWNPNKFPFKNIYNFFKRKEKDFLTNADSIVTLTYKAKEIVEGWQKEFSLGTVPITVIPCSADLELFNYENLTESTIQDVRLELGIEKDSITFAYLGSIGTWYLLKEMMEFFSQALKNDKNLTFLFVTTDSKSSIIDCAKSFGVEDKVKIVAATREKVTKYLSVADYSIFFISPSFSKQASSPVKHGECLGLGLPIICNRKIGDVDTITQNSSSGVLIDLSDIENEAKKIKFEKLTKERRQQIRKVAFDYYDLADATQKYYTIYKNLI